MTRTAEKDIRGVRQALLTARTRITRALSSASTDLERYKLEALRATNNANLSYLASTWGAEGSTKR